MVVNCSILQKHIKYQLNITKKKKIGFLSNDFLELSFNINFLISYRVFIFKFEILNFFQIGGMIYNRGSECTLLTVTTVNICACATVTPAHNVNGRYGGGRGRPIYASSCSISSVRSFFFSNFSFHYMWLCRTCLRNTTHEE